MYEFYVCKVVCREDITDLNEECSSEIDYEQIRMNELNDLLNQNCIEWEHDYAKWALVDSKNKVILYEADNIHQDIYTYLEAFFEALDYVNIKYSKTETFITEYELSRRF